MKRKITAAALGLLLILSSFGGAFALEKSIQPVSQTGRISNADSSLEISYNGEPSRVFYGSEGISILGPSGETHLETNFKVLKLVQCQDVDGDGTRDFFTVQDAPQYAAQLMTVSGKDGSVLAELRLTRMGYSELMGDTEQNCYIQQLLAAEDGSVIVVYDYNIAKLDPKTGTILFSLKEADNIWKAASAGDVNGDGIQDFAYTAQNNTIGIVSGADGSRLKEWHPCKEYSIPLRMDANTTAKTVMNVWDIMLAENTLYATTEDGFLVCIDLSEADPQPTLLSLGAIGEDYLIQYFSTYRMRNNGSGWFTSQSGVSDWVYMGYRISDFKDGFLLIDCYLGAKDGLSRGNDASWPAATLLFSTSENAVRFSLPAGSLSLPYLKTCLTSYEGTPCIATALSVSDKAATFALYDYKGELLTQKEIKLETVSPSSKIELYAQESGFRAEIFEGGAVYISEDLKTAQYAYSNVTATLLCDAPGGLLVCYSVNGQKKRIAKLSPDTKSVIWEYSVPEDFANKGMEFIRTDRDMDEDGVNDILAVINSYDEDGQQVASWLTAVSGADGSVLMFKTIKTGEATIDRKKVIYYLKTESLDLISDIDGDRKPELLCASTVVGSRRDSVIGELYGSPGVSGTQLPIGDANEDGIKDYVVVSEKEARVYLSRLVYSWGFVSVDYRKTNYSVEMNKALDPLSTSGVLGDVNADGADEVVFIGKNSENHQVFKVYSGKDLEFLYDLCPEGATDGEAYISLGYDINGDGFSEIWGRQMWENCIFSGKTGEVLLNLSRVGQNEDLEEFDDGIIWTGTMPGGKWYPDYNVPFMTMDEKPGFIMIPDANGDGLKDLACVANRWDDETFASKTVLTVLSSSDFKTISETDLGSGVSAFTPIAVENSERYIVLSGDESISVVDMQQKQLLAQFAITAQSAMLQGAGTLLISGKDGELLRLDLGRSFELDHKLPEETDDFMLPIFWKPLQGNSVMTIYDNNTPVYSGNGEDFRLHLLEGKHDISLAMDDGQGKTYRENYTVTLSPQHTSYTWIFVAGGAALIACIFFGVLRKARIKEAIRRGQK